MHGEEAEKASAGVPVHEMAGAGERVRMGHRTTMLLEGSSKTASFEVVAEELDGAGTCVKAEQERHYRATARTVPMTAGSWYGVG